MTPIKIRAKDIKRLDYAIRAFNAKITREEKKNASAFEYLPKRVERSELWAKIATRKDYNRILESLQRATKKKDAFNPVESASGLRLTKWEKKEFEYNVRRTNYLRGKEREKFNDIVYSGSLDNMFKQVSYNIDTMSSKEWELARNFTSNASQEMYNFYNYKKYQNAYIGKLEEIFDGWDELQPRVQSMVNWLKNKEPEFLFAGQLKYKALSLEYLYETWKMIEKLDQLEYYWGAMEYEWGEER